jgi:DNA processing protein
MKYTENAINILATKTFNGIGRAWIVKNLKGNESIEEIIELINKKSKQSYEVTFNDFGNKREQIIEKLNKLGESCDGLIAIGDKNFPKCRGNVKQSEQPIFLFYKGDIKLLNIENNNISVIGLLDPDIAIETRERKVVKELVNNNITIVSGLALGCDSIAHMEALNGGKTIAILPSPLNNILPARNKGLAYEIVEQGGLLVTEYYEDFKSKMELNSRYKERDRLQALFCDTIVLAASYSLNSAKVWKIYGKKLDSGARLAMEYAKNYHIPRAVMYNEKTDFNNPMFDLNRQLIKEDKSVIILTNKNIGKIIDDIKRRKILNYRFQKNLFNQ